MVVSNVFTKKTLNRAMRDFGRQLVIELSEKTLRDLAVIGQQAGKQRIQNAGAVATRELIDNYKVIRRGRSFVVGVIVPPERINKPFFVDQGATPHIVRVDNKRSEFEPWAQAVGLDNSVGPWFTYVGGRSVPVHLGHDGPIYLAVGFNNPVFQQGVKFVDATFNAIVEETDELTSLAFDEAVKRAFK